MHSDNRTVWQYIHSAHVIHRDLKPSNVLVNESSDLKVRAAAQRPFSLFPPSLASLSGWVCRRGGAL